MDLKHLIWLLAFLFAGVMAAQAPESARTWIPMIVQTSHHEPALNLSPGSLVIAENRVQATDIRLLDPAELPLRLGILVDVSNSERERNFPKLFAAAKDFATRALHGPDDRVFFMKFDVTPEDTGWLTREQVPGVPETQRASGGTAIFDSVVSACTNLMGVPDWNKPTRRVIVLISDGEDNASHVKRDVALTDAIQGEVVVFTFATSVLTGTPRGDAIMEDFAKLTGGKFFPNASDADAAKAFSETLRLVDGMYLASFTRASGAERITDIEVKPAPGEKLEILHPKKHVSTQ